MRPIFFFFFTSRVEASGCGTNDEPIHYHYKHLQAAQTTMEVMHTLRFKSLKCCRAYREFIVFENHKPCRKMWMNFVCIYTWHINGRYTIERLTMTYSQWPPLTSARTTLRKCLPSPCEWHMHDMLASNECSMQNNLTFLGVTILLQDMNNDTVIAIRQVLASNQQCTGNNLCSTDKAGPQNKLMVIQQADD